MKQSRFSKTQIVTILKEVDAGIKVDKKTINAEFFDSISNQYPFRQG
ncbi:hypothetical protein [Celerinatantimonas sp. YJH-8]